MVSLTVFAEAKEPSRNESADAESLNCDAAKSINENPLQSNGIANNTQTDCNSDNERDVKSNPPDDADRDFNNSVSDFTPTGDAYSSDSNCDKGTTIAPHAERDENEFGQNKVTHKHSERDADLIVEKQGESEFESADNISDDNENRDVSDENSDSAEKNSDEFELESAERTLDAAVSSSLETRDISNNVQDPSADVGIEKADEATADSYPGVACDENQDDSDKTDFSLEKPGLDPQNDSDDLNANVCADEKEMSDEELNGDGFADFGSFDKSEYGVSNDKNRDDATACHIVDNTRTSESQDDDFDDFAEFGSFDTPDLAVTGNAIVDDFSAFDNHNADNPDVGFGNFTESKPDEPDDDFGDFSSDIKGDDFSEFNSGSSHWSAFSNTVTKKLTLGEKVVVVAPGISRDPIRIWCSLCRSIR